MWRITLVLVAVVMLPGAVFAQTKVVPLVGNSPVSNSNPLPVTGTVTPSGTSDVNLKQYNGSAVGAGNAQYVQPGTSANFKVNIDQTTPGTTNKVVTDVASTVSNSPTLTTGSAYASGNSLGGLQTFSGVTGTGGGWIQTISAASLVGSTHEIDVFVFNANPTGSTCTDKTAFALAQADFSKLVPGSPIVVSASIAAGTPTVRVAQNLAISFQPSTLYVCYVTRGTPTFASATDTQFQWGIVARTTP